MSAQDWEALGQRIVEAVKAYVARATDPITTRLSAAETRIAAVAMMRAGGAPDALRLLGELETRLRALETRPQVSYRGVWRAGDEHQPGNFVTDKGSLWHAWQTTTDRPGTSDSWQLVAKNGRDR